MDPILLAIADTVLLAWAHASWRQRHRQAPGRPLPLPHYQRRTLTCLLLVLACQVLATWLVGRRAGAERQAIGGLLPLDVAALAGLAVACGALGRTATRERVAAVGLGLGVWAASLGFGWLLVLLAGTSAPGSALIAAVGEAWGASPGTLGLVALYHYGLGAFLLAAGIAARDLFPELPAFGRDNALRPVALLASLTAVVYLLFTWRML